MTSPKLTTKEIKSIPQLSNLGIDLDFTLPYFEANALSENVDPHYVFDKNFVTQMGDYLFERIEGFTTDGFIAEGPTGSGKTSAIRNLLAILNYPVHVMKGHADLELSQAFGRLDPMEGILGYLDGPLTLAARHGHAFLFEERECAPADVNKGLNNTLDGYDIPLTDVGFGTKVPLATGFAFFATQNTSAGMDFSGEYGAAIHQDSSSEDRFEKAMVPYNSPEIEEQILIARLGDSIQPIASSIAEVADIARNGYRGNIFATNPSHSIPVSTRGINRFARMILRDTNSLTSTENLKRLITSTFPVFKETDDVRNAFLESFYEGLMK